MPFPRFLSGAPLKLMTLYRGIVGIAAAFPRFLSGAPLKRLGIDGHLAEVVRSLPWIPIWGSIETDTV